MIAFAGLLLIATAGQSRSAPPPPPPALVVTPERIAIGPGPVLRSTSLAGAPPLPAEGVAIAFRCQTGRGGALHSCAPAGQASEWDVFASRRMRGYRLDVDDLGLGQLASVPVVITVRLSPGDLIDPATTGEIAPDSSALTIIEQPNVRPDHGLYPLPAIRAGIQTRVELTCRVLPDLSLFCPEGRLAAQIPPELGDHARFEPLFVFAAQQLTGLTRVAQTLKDGRPAIGHQFRFSVGFRLPGE